MTSQKPLDERRKSCETVCSSNSSCILQKRRPVHPLAAGSIIRPNLTRSTNNAVRQRVLSAKLLRLKTLQNQLNDTNFHLAEVIRENKALKTLQRRQDKALSRYEGTNADLPRLLQSHEEEIRALTEKNRVLKRTQRELQEQIKLKNEEIGIVNDQLKHLNQLSKDKNLLEREKLMEQIEEFKEKLERADNQLSMQNRRLTLETKTIKHKLHAEIIKHKGCQRELLQAQSDIVKLTTLLQAKEKLTTTAISPRRSKRFLSKRQTISSSSLLCLDDGDGSGSKTSLINDEIIPPGVIDVKLEPLLHATKTVVNNNKQAGSAINGILSSPVDNIRARLSADLRKITYSDEDQALLLSTSMDKMSLSSTDDGNNNSSTSSAVNSINKYQMGKKSRPNSMTKLEKITTLQDSSSSPINIDGVETDRSTVDTDDVDDGKRIINDYYAETVKNCNDTVEMHQESFTASKSGTDKLIDALRETDSMEMGLKYTHLLSTFDDDDDDAATSTLINHDNIDLVSQILKDEINYQRSAEDNKIRTDRNGNISSNRRRNSSSVNLNEKRRLLATLRAIDNGDNVETFENKAETKSKLMQELFGDIDG